MNLTFASRAWKVLLVEDDENIRGAFTTLLSETGYDVREAATGADALRIAAEWHPQLILMDVGLPDGDGLEFTRQLKADPDTADSIVVAITGRAAPSDRNACLDAGCAAFLPKPVRASVLLDRIAELLG